MVFRSGMRLLSRGFGGGFWGEEERRRGGRRGQ